MTRRVKPVVCLVGSDTFNLHLVQEIAEAADWDIVPVLSSDDVQPSQGKIDFDDLLRRAEGVISDLAQGPDAIIGHLDFPVTALVSLLNRKFGLPGASPEAVARCEHKYWMRQEQAAEFPDTTPRTVPLNPFAPEAAHRDAPEYPFWMKPVKAHSSKLGHLVRDDADFDAGLHACRNHIHQHGEPFNVFLGHLDKECGQPSEIDGNFALAEELISAPRLFTLEGFVRKGRPVIYGAIESRRGGPSGTSLSSYHYPAAIPKSVIDTATATVGRLLKRFGFDDAPFNVEFFWNDETDELHLLEINPRFSKSHSPLFRIVDGASHHKQAIQLALGQKPELPSGQGAQPMAAKYMIRSTEADGLVRRVPTDDEISALKKLIPDLEVQVLVGQNERLSSLPDQDSYTYELADLFIGGAGHEVIEDAYRRCLDSMDFHIKPLPEGYP
ncbi:ATP-grasp domain-containing protein [Tranquillimonas rosea]|uniref:ATP-grasp domain-containing protein n=1 Tax=Tranquillimonas rosea TaxID=641238 RepID=UPI003BAB97D2